MVNLGLVDMVCLFVGLVGVVVGGGVGVGGGGGLGVYLYVCTLLSGATTQWQWGVDTMD
jgi:hypothetical protein